MRRSSLLPKQLLLSKLPKQLLLSSPSKSSSNSRKPSRQPHLLKVRVANRNRLPRLGVQTFWARISRFLILGAT
jgi:hypothetical protein